MAKSNDFKGGETFPPPEKSKMLAKSPEPGKHSPSGRRAIDVWLISVMSE